MTAPGPGPEDDLTADDHLVENTPKEDYGDADLPEADQDPSEVPDSAVDENGARR